MVKHLILALYLLSFSSSADYNYFFFKKSQIKVPEASFQRYIQPQLKSLVVEFFLILKKTHPFHGELLELRKHLRKQKKEWEEVRRICKIKEEPEKCEKSYKNFYTLTKDLDIILLKTQMNFPEFSKLEFPTQKDNLLGVISIIKKITNENYKMIHFLEEHFITSRTVYENFYHADKQFSSIIHKNELELNLTYSALLPSDYRQDFEDTFTGFILPVEEFIIDGDNFNYLVDNLEELNIVWNTFHMRIEKGNLSIAKQHISLVKIMHNRWNSVLKMLLRGP